MTSKPNSAVVFLRMAPALRDGLRAAANEAGCSVNAFALQVLASAVGDPARFRSGSMPVAAGEPVELERDALGYPLNRVDRDEHIGARSNFIGVMEHGRGAREMVALVKHYDAEDPGYFVRWRRERESSPGAA